MKVGELREKLSKLKKEEIIKIASEFYKLVPKDRKEDNDLDSLIENPKQQLKKNKPKELESLEELEVLVKQFAEDARNQYYLIPNRIVSKKERSTWRFKVKRWYKSLSNTSRQDKNIDKQAELLADLYEVISESCGFQYFTAFDSFGSIGVEQVVFYRTVVNLLQESKGKLESLQKCIELIIDSELNWQTLHLMLMNEFISTLENVDSKYKAIEVAEKLIKEKNKTEVSSSQKYQQQRTINNLFELVLRLRLSLYEVEEGIAFYHKYYQENSDEVKLFILIRILFEQDFKDEIVNEIEKAVKMGIEPRDSLMDLLSEIKKTGQLPDYM